MSHGKQATLAGRVDDAGAERLARRFASQLLLAMGNLEGARVHAEKFLALSERLHNRTYMVTALFEQPVRVPS